MHLCEREKTFGTTAWASIEAGECKRNLLNQLLSGGERYVFCKCTVENDQNLFTYSNEDSFVADENVYCMTTTPHPCFLYVD